MAEQTKHTPEPWIIRRFGTSHGGDAYVMDSIPDDQHGRCVANIIATPNTNPRWEANARLIAAAPDLLAACRHLLQAIQDDPMAAQFFDLRHIEAARAAIAKATSK